jgi:hypothetical protein
LSELDLEHAEGRIIDELTYHFRRDVCRDGRAALAAQNEFVPQLRRRSDFSLAGVAHT